MAEKIVDADPQSDPVLYIYQGIISAFGGGSPREQIASSIILATLAYVTALLSFGATAVFILLFSVTFFVGLLRLLFRAVTG